LKKCAEVLVPHSVDPKFLIGAYAVNAAVTDKLSQTCALPITVNASMFFR